MDGEHGLKMIRKNIDINKLLCKLWITDALYVIPANVTNNSVASSIIPKIYQRDFKRLYLSDQLFSLNEFLFLCSSVKDLTLKEVTVKNGDSNVIPLAKLVEKLPNVKRINYIFTTPSNNTSKNTFKQLWKIPNLSNYNYFGLGMFLGSFV
uniref:Uncharacterized protein n=1 Tax=Panagrolaimus superbus TaxID=310955 RepID=A0A914XWK2_9BILA